MNIVPGAPWYRRFRFGDRLPHIPGLPPQKTRTLFEANTGRHWIIIERHKGCSCSMCRGEGPWGRFFCMPQDRERGWRTLNFFRRLYVRWVPLRRT